MRIKEFNRGEDIQLSDNFNSKEFECKCGVCQVQLVDLDHVEKLQQLRDSLGSSIRITSGYRCPAHNQQVGGVPDSQHLKGTATDIQSDAVEPSELANKCEHFDGLGRYKTFVHVDSRGYKARWASNP
jgi:uncharacterized protein YcbK (DUF882 family)